MAPSEAKDTNAHEFVWYHDLKWASRGENAAAAAPGGGIEATLKLTNGQQININFKSPEQLANLISSLERAI